MSRNIEQEKQRIERLLDSLQQSYDALVSIPEDDFPIESVLTWSKRFRDGGIAYHYAAIKTGRGWFTTGTQQYSPYTWLDLVQEIRRDAVEPPVVYWAAEFEIVEGI